MPQVFVSHSTDDREEVEEIVRSLRQRGVNVWYSPEVIATSEQWDRSIRAGLESSDLFLLVMSNNAAVSPWVRAEIRWAVAKLSSKIVGVVLEDCDISKFPNGIDRCRLFAFHGADRASAREEFLSLFGATNARAPVEPSAPARPPDPFASRLVNLGMISGAITGAAWASVFFQAQAWLTLAGGFLGLFFGSLNGYRTGLTLEADRWPWPRLQRSRWDGLFCYLGAAALAGVIWLGRTLGIAISMDYPNLPRVVVLAGPLAGAGTGAYMAIWSACIVMRTRAAVVSGSADNIAGELCRLSTWVGFLATFWITRFYFEVGLFWQIVCSLVGLTFSGVLVAVVAELLAEKRERSLPIARWFQWMVGAIVVVGIVLGFVVLGPTLASSPRQAAGVVLFMPVLNHLSGAGAGALAGGFVGTLVLLFHFPPSKYAPSHASDLSLLGAFLGPVGAYLAVKHFVPGDSYWPAIAAAVGLVLSAGLLAGLGACVASDRHESGRCKAWLSGLTSLLLVFGVICGALIFGPVFRAELDASFSPHSPWPLSWGMIGGVGAGVTVGAALAHLVCGAANHIVVHRLTVLQSSVAGVRILLLAAGTICGAWLVGPTLTAWMIWSNTLIRWDFYVTRLSCYAFGYATAAYIGMVVGQVIYNGIERLCVGLGIIRCPTRSADAYAGAIEQL